MSTPEEIEELRFRLREMMTNDGFTQVDVAKVMGLSQSVVSRFIRGEHKKPTADTLKRIRAFLGDEEHPEVISHEDVRRAVRLYRYIRGVLADGAQITVRNKDGTENTLIFIW